MIQIRPEQYATFEKSAHAHHKEELVAHLKEFAPKHAAGVGDEGLRKLIRSGIRSAGDYGFQLRGSLRFYVECQVMFGHEFPTDPLIPWAAREFGQRGWINELDRADAIHEVAMEYRKAVVGEKEEIEAAAIRRLLKKPAEEWLRGDLSEAATLQFVNEVYPEKMALALRNAGSQLLSQGKRAATTNQLPVPTGSRVMTALMVAFGHGVLTDPQFPWIAAHLEDTRNRPPEKRVESLAVRILAYLSDGLKNLERE